MSTSSLNAASAANDEAKGKSRIFVWKYVVDLETPDPETGRTTEDRQLTLSIPRKYKRFKFSRALASGDVMTGMEIVFGKEQVAELEELEMTDEEFELFMERLGEALGGTTTKN